MREGKPNIDSIKAKMLTNSSIDMLEAISGWNERNKHSHRIRGFLLYEIKKKKKEKKVYYQTNK